MLLKIPTGARVFLPQSVNVARSCTNRKIRYETVILLVLPYLNLVKAGTELAAANQAEISALKAAVQAQAEELQDLQQNILLLEALNHLEAVGERQVHARESVAEA
ncbi:uncharacterized protein [Dermacentor albipictus]|uniref:uncharacterized protein n=1 Tax=Dermacentor albipictus TaxID=60249 RepID=UPI0038FBF651